jgi:hypothetical protein
MLFQFKIQLKNIHQPTVWRRVTVPSHFSFTKFHRVIQAAFGWYDCHLFQFSPGGYGSSPIISIPDPDIDRMQQDNRQPLHSTKTKLADIFTVEKQKFKYIYDFGDDWIHEITLEKIVEDESKAVACLAGKGACPPEDCGGPWGFASLKKILTDPTHPEYAETREWLGLEQDEEWNAAEFNLEEVQANVRIIK